MQNRQALSRSQMPYANCLVTAAGRQERILEVYVNVTDLLLVPSERSQQAAVAGVPALDEVIVHAGEHQPPAPVKADAVDGGEVAQDALLHVHRLEKLRLLHVRGRQACAQLLATQVD